MPLLNTGIIRYKYLSDKITRILLTLGLNFETCETATHKLLNLIKDKVKTTLTDDDVIEVKVEYNVEDNEVHWNADTLSITIFRPVGYLESRLSEYEAERERLQSKIQSLEEEIAKLKEKYESLKRLILEVKDLIERVSVVVNNIIDLLK